MLAEQVSAVEASDPLFQEWTEKSNLGNFLAKNEIWKNLPHLVYLHTKPPSMKILFQIQRLRTLEETSMQKYNASNRLF